MFFPRPGVQLGLPHRKSWCSSVGVVRPNSPFTRTCPPNFYFILFQLVVLILSVHPLLSPPIIFPKFCVLSQDWINFHLYSSNLVINNTFLLNLDFFAMCTKRARAWTLGLWIFFSNSGLLIFENIKISIHPHGIDQHQISLPKRLLHAVLKKVV